MKSKGKDETYFLCLVACCLAPQGDAKFIKMLAQSEANQLNRSDERS